MKFLIRKSEEQVRENRFNLHYSDFNAGVQSGYRSNLRLRVELGNTDTPTLLLQESSQSSSYYPDAKPASKFETPSNMAFNRKLKMKNQVQRHGGSTNQIIFPIYNTNPKYTLTKI